MRVTRGQIEKALEAVNGTVSRAAKILGIARKNLYIRMATLGISPDDYRRNTSPVSPVTPTVTRRGWRKATGVIGSGAVRGSGSVFANDTFTTPIAAPTLARVQERTAPGTVADPPDEESRKLRQPRSVYLRPDQWRELDGACFDLAAKRRERQSPSKVTEQFFDRYFSKFLAEELSAPKRKKNGDSE
jgi:hypothetical protein